MGQLLTCCSPGCSQNPSAAPTSLFQCNCRKQQGQSFLSKANISPVPHLDICRNEGLGLALLSTCYCLPVGFLGLNGACTSRSIQSYPQHFKKKSILCLHFI